MHYILTFNNILRKKGVQYYFHLYCSLIITPDLVCLQIYFLKVNILPFS